MISIEEDRLKKQKAIKKVFQEINYTFNELMRYQYTKTYSKLIYTTNQKYIGWSIGELIEECAYIYYFYDVDL
jgi:hypothetical protein